MNKPGAIAVLALFVVVACAPADGGSTMQASGEPPSDAFIDSVTATFLAGMRAKDPAPMMANYADDAVSYTPNAPPVVGKAAIMEGNRQWFASLEVDSVWAEHDPLLHSGDLAVETGSYYFKGKMFGQPAEDRGRYMTVWQRQADGSWKIVRDMANSSNPMPAPAAQQK
jgi:ketosteroid isomerase-like protein